MYTSGHWYSKGIYHIDIVKVKVEHLLQHPFAGKPYRRGAQVHGAHQAASHTPALYLPNGGLLNIQPSN